MINTLRYPSIDKFGVNLDIDTTTDPEDVWAAGGTFNWLSAAGPCTIESDSVEDDTDKPGAGTGAWTVSLTGILASGLEATETVTLNGTTAVALANQYQHVYRAYVVTVGSGGVNAGNILIKQGATTIAYIAAGKGQTQQATLRVPNYTAAHPTKRPYITHVKAYLAKGTAGAAMLDLYTRTAASGYSWRSRYPFALNSQGAGLLWVALAKPISVEVGSDIKLTVDEVSANDMAVAGGFTVTWLP